MDGTSAPAGDALTTWKAMGVHNRITTAFGREKRVQRKYSVHVLCR